MNLARSLGSVGGLTLVSRVLALVRDTLQASYVGASFASDAFFVAFRLPNMFRALFAEGAFSAAFIPMFNRKVGEADDVNAGLRFAEQTLAVLLPVLLVFTVLGATDDRAPAGFAGLPIGLILTTIILAGIPVTNGSFNPARSIGPAVFVGGWALQQLWLFIVAPLVGGALAARLYLGIRMPAPMITPRQAETALPSEQAERRTAR